MELHCIGDSHTEQFLGKIPDTFYINSNITQYKNNNSINYSYKNRNIKIFSYRCCEDGALAFTIKKRKDIINKILSNVSNNSFTTVIFMFGEVDCRYKLLEYALKKYNNSQNINYNNLNFESICSKGVHDVLNNYIPFIKNIENTLYDKVNICLWGPHATFMNATYYHAMTGNGQIRNKVTFIFNENLKNVCKQNNWKYCSTFDLLIDDNFITKNIGKQHTWRGYDVRKYPNRNENLVKLNNDFIYVTNSSDIWMDMMHLNHEFSRDKLLSQIL